MISHLGIRGLGVIRAADVDLSPGLVVFTGETGAGKTMLVSALGLVLGDRFDSGLLGADGTRVEASVDVPTASPVVDRVRAAGGVTEERPGDDVELIIGRHVAASGRSRAVVGGATVPLSLLSDVGAAVAQRHSQSDQIGLRSSRTQRQALDRFAGAELAEALGRYQQKYCAYLELSERLSAVTSAEQTRGDRVELLTAELAAIDEVAPTVEDGDELTVAIARLANAEALRLDLAAATEALAAEDDGAVTLMGRAAAALERAGRHDPSLQDHARRLLDLQELSSDLALEIQNSSAQVSADPERLAALQNRKAAVSPLLRRFGPTVVDVMARAERARAELAELTDADGTIARLREQVAVALADLATAADRLTQVRRGAALSLAQAVTDELAGLSMPQATFSVAVDHREHESGLMLADGATVAFGESGIDVVRFLLAPHAGATPAPIGDGASGGELSRIMLALEVVLAASSPPSVFIFDEVDAGIGGRTAVEVGRRLARLARDSQVLVVTHLPQVASFADQHIVVRKDSDGMVTATSVAEVKGPERTAELSRMLSGQDDSEAARAHAEELLDLAAVESRGRAGTGGSR